MRGKFITLEGIEGCGKTTHARLLASQLEEAGHDVMLTREPGGTAVGEAVRDLVKHGAGEERMCPEAEMLLFAASRAQLVRLVIEPALRSGVMVVSDRYVDSTTAYQGYARGLDIDTVLALNKFVSDDLVPDITIVLDVPVEVGLRRARSRQRDAAAMSDRIEGEELPFHTAVRDAYLKLAQQSPDRINVVAGTNEVDVVSEDIWRTVSGIVAGTV